MLRLLSVEHGDCVAVRNGLPLHRPPDAGTKEAAEALLRNIASEQLVAWYLLYRLLSDRWADVFSPWKNSLEDFGKRLRQHEQYLQIAFDELKPELEKRVDAGASFRECPSCGFASLELEDEIGDLFEGTCLVCTFHERCVSIECPECSAPVTLFGTGFGQCHECEKKFEPDDVANLINDDQVDTKDYFASGLPAHYVDCDAYQTVVSHGGSYVCASCF